MFSKMATRLTIVLSLVIQISTGSPSVARLRRQSFNFENIPSLDIDQDNQATTTQAPGQTNGLDPAQLPDPRLTGDPSGQSFDFGGSSTDWAQGQDVGPPVPVPGFGDLPSDPDLDPNIPSDLAEGEASVPNMNFDFSMNNGAQQGPGGNTPSQNSGSTSGESIESQLPSSALGPVAVPSDGATINDWAGVSGENKTFDFGANSGAGGEDAWSNGATVATVDIVGAIIPTLDVQPEEDSENSNVSMKEKEDELPRVGHSRSATLRPLEERMCRGQDIWCKHGICQGSEESDQEAFHCVCDDGWFGHFCEYPCTLRCQNGGTCRLLDPVNTLLGERVTEEGMFCNCPHKWTGAQCEEVKPDPEEDARTLAAILASCIAIVLLLAVLLPVMLWRMRVIFIMKFVYFFKNYEDDDGKLYDAYVSLSPCPEAESFVYSALAPRLEDLGFNLYLQARDLPGGAVMSESILGAIEKSRRTILVVTSDYVDHEWARLEYLFAQRETLKLRQRIIPIIVGDLDQEKVRADKSLKHILSSIKCLRCPASLTPGSPNHLSPDSARSPDPLVKTSTILKDKLRLEHKEEKFWKRLELTMPKKRQAEQEEVDRHLTSYSPNAITIQHPLHNRFKQTDAKYDISSSFLVIGEEKTHPLETKKKMSQTNSFNLNSSCVQVNEQNLRKNLMMDPFFLELKQEGEGSKPTQTT